MRDLRLALRGLLRTPGFTLVAVLTLGLGIGANTAIFSVVDNVVFRPLAYPDADALVMLGQSRDRGVVGTVSWPDFADWRGQARSFTGMAAVHSISATFANQSPGAQPERLDGMTTSADFFDVVGVPPILGRGFQPGEDDNEKGRKLVVLGYATWQSHFAGDPGVIGRSVTFDDLAFTVIGVAAPDLGAMLGDQAPAFFMPAPHGSVEESMRTGRGGHYLNVIARLAAGVTPAGAQAEMDTIEARLTTAFPDDEAGHFTTVMPLHRFLVGDSQPALLALLAAVALVLLIACANVASLLLGRASSRRRELAIRVALGAGRGRLIRQMLAESLVLGVLGGAFGLLVALWGLDALRGLIPAELERIHHIVVDGRVLLFTLLMSLVTGAAFGLFPALQASRSDPNEALAAASSRSTTARQRVRQALVAGEIAVALILLIGAGLTLQSFHRLNQVATGLAPADVVALRLSLPDSHYAEDAQQIAFEHDLEDRLAAVPGVSSAAIGLPMPYSRNNLGLTFDVIGAPPRAAGDQLGALFRTVSPGWFSTLGIPLRAGRTFNRGDDQAKAAPVIVINETMARTLFGSGDPLGHRIAVSINDHEPREVIGVVGDVRDKALDQAPSMEMYVPYAQVPWPTVYAVVRTPAGLSAASALGAAVHAIDAGQPVGEVRRLDRMIDDSLARRRLTTLLLGLFAATALALALVGVYGVMSYAVAQRTPEIGLRIALGARPAQVVRWIVRQGLVLAAIGVGVGVGGALALSQLLAGMLYGIPATDPLTYLVLSVALVGVAALASWLPARRAARVDPMVALRYE